MARHNAKNLYNTWEELKMSLYQSQKSVKPKIEDVAGNFLDAGKTAALLNLAEFIRTEKIGIQWASANSWALNYKNKRLGYIKIQNGLPWPHLNGIWRFCHNRNYLDRYYSMEECDLKTFIFDNIYAKTCGGDTCQSNPNAQKAGYMNPTDCGCYPLRIFNPNEEKLEYTKQLIKYRKNCILEDSK